MTATVEMNRVTLDAREAQFMREAYRNATLSSDPSTQNGAVIVIAGSIRTHGFNVFPMMIAERPERWERPLKYSYIEHAERNSIYDAIRNQTRISGGTMYCCWAACADCARAIIQAGLRRLVVHHDPLAPERFGVPVAETWRESIGVALSMLNEAMVQIDCADNDLFGGTLKVRFQGQEVCP